MGALDSIEEQSLTYVATSYYRPTKSPSHKAGLAIDIVFKKGDTYPVLSRFGNGGFVASLPDKADRGDFFDYFFGFLALLLKLPGLAGYIAFPAEKGKSWCKHYHAALNNKYGYEYSLHENGKCRGVRFKLLPKEEFILELKSWCASELMDNAKWTKEKSVDTVQKYCEWAVSDAIFLFKTSDGVLLPNGQRATHKDIRLFFDQAATPPNEFPWGWVIAGAAALLLFTSPKEQPEEPVLIRRRRRTFPAW